MMCEYFVNGGYRTYPSFFYEYHFFLEMLIKNYVRNHEYYEKILVYS